MNSAQITVIFPLYHAARKISALVASLRDQKHPDYPSQKDWLRVLFVDNASQDGTVEVLNQELAKLGHPENYQIVVNEKNLGLSRSLNKAFSLVSTDYALTCHSDCLFGSSDYVYRMLKHMQNTPDAGAITGVPAIPADKVIPLVEKINLVANLMDLFPETKEDRLVPVGFPEGRCDIFRMKALQAAGYYDTTLRLAGEDQILAANMRKHDYVVYQAQGLLYFLSVSVQQDTLSKLLSHQRLFGRAHPYILLTQRRTRVGVIGKEAGSNRQLRALLRAHQLLCCFLYVMIPILMLVQAPWLFLAALLLGIVLMKLFLFRRHMNEVSLSLAERALFWVMQIPLDVSYSLGVMQGAWYLTGGAGSKEIS